MIGETGSGKTTLARAIVGLVEPIAGSVAFEGREITGLRGRARRAFRRAGGIQLVFQDPLRSLDPDLTVEAIVAEGLAVRGACRRDERRAARARARSSSSASIPSLASRRPGEISGGQRQRVSLARAVDPRAAPADLRRAGQRARRLEPQLHPAHPRRAARSPRAGHARDLARPRQPRGRRRPRRRPVPRADRRGGPDRRGLRRAAAPVHRAPDRVGAAPRAARASASTSSRSRSAAHARRRRRRRRRLRVRAALPLRDRAVRAPSSRRRGSSCPAAASSATTPTEPGAHERAPDSEGRTVSRTSDAHASAHATLDVVAVTGNPRAGLAHRGARRGTSRWRSPRASAASSRRGSSSSTSPRRRTGRGPRRSLLRGATLAVDREPDLQGDLHGPAEDAARRRAARRARRRDRDPADGRGRSRARARGRAAPAARARRARRDHADARALLRGVAARGARRRARSLARAGAAGARRARRARGCGDERDRCCATR